MEKRPGLNRNLDSRIFKSYYYLKEELVHFCREHGLPSNGGKPDLTARIERYLDTGEILSGKRHTRKTADTGLITEETPIEHQLVCSEKHRAFFKKAIGKNFTFNGMFQKWLKANPGKTYNDAIQAYYRILEEKKTNPTVIDKQFEYNTYIRDFFTDNKDKSLKEAITCWKYKKGLPGPRNYKKTDLEVLL